jgi:endoglucanase
VAIAIDVSHADQPMTSEADTVPLNAGMAIAIGPNIHPLIFEKLTQVANANEIPFKLDPSPGPTGTNAWAMQVVREGIPTGLIDVPLRYMHTSVETISLSDVERIGRLLALFCASLDENFSRQLRGEAEVVEESKTKNVKHKTARKRKR